MSYEPLSLVGRTAVVLGGTSGIGRTLSLGLAQAGADVVVSARRQHLVDAVASEIEREGRKTLRIASDVGQRSSLERLLAETLAAFGKVDVLVNCAGITKRLPSLDVTEEDW